MISPGHESWRVVLYEGRGARPLSDDARFALMTGLLERGYAVSRALDNGASKNDAGGAASATPLSACGAAHLVVLGDFESGAAPSLEDADGHAELHAGHLDPVTAERAIELVEQAQAARGAKRPGGWKPWFPVIDFDRCTNCMQCLSFCLFDVYGVSPSGGIQVQNQSNCKTDCPACSRVCPEVAILFPKYKAGPINGDEVSDDDVRREAMKVDISSLLGGDIYSMLRDRSEKAKSRFSRERDDDRALKERMRCLKKLTEGVADLEIPPEVISSLPSLDQIQAKAAEARRRAEEALGRKSPES